MTALPWDEQRRGARGTSKTAGQRLPSGYDNNDTSRTDNAPRRHEHAPLLSSQTCAWKRRQRRGMNKGRCHAAGGRAWTGETAAVEGFRRTTAPHRQPTARVEQGRRMNDKGMTLGRQRARRLVAQDVVHAKRTGGQKSWMIQANELVVQRWLGGTPNVWKITSD